MADLKRWLAEVGLTELADTLAANDIGLDILSALTDADLREIGLTLGQRKRLLKAAAGLAGHVAAPAAARASRTAGEGERRQMTILFCDMVGSTQLTSRLDPEDMFQVVATYQRSCAEVIQRFGGHVAKYLGDGVLAYFGFPQAHEDDAERAVRAGLELTAVIRTLAVRPAVNLQARVGIDTGLVVIGDLLDAAGGDEETVVGDTTNLAARLQAMAPPDGVVIGENTHRLVGEMFACAALPGLELKGFAGPVLAWSVLGEGRAEGRFEARARGNVTPLIGRTNELEMLVERWRLARSGEGQVLLLSGEGGLGKSRLVDALGREIAGDPHTRLRYFCSQFYAGTALYPVVDQMRRAAGLRREDPLETRREKLDALLRAGGEDPGRSGHLLATLLSLPDGERAAPQMSAPERKAATIELLLRQVEALARRQPLLIVFEDVHWIDPTTSELLGQLIGRVRSLAALVVVTFRPEFTPPWRMQPHVSALQLNRFGRRQALELMERVAGGRRLPEPVRDLVLERTDGIPLFVEELTKALLEGGSLVLNGDAYELVGPLPLIRIPSTLHDSLMARLDRLAGVKEVALWASALGRSFTAELLAGVAPLPRRDIDDALARLVDAEMLYRHGAAGEEVFEFKHALVQDAAYGSMLRNRRQQMHARIAEVLELSFPDTAANRPEVLAHHFGEAGLVEKAYQYSVQAGDSAAARYASPEARLRFQAALELASSLPDGRRAKKLAIRAVLKLAGVALGREQVEAALVDLARAREFAEAIDHRPRLSQVNYWIARLNYVSGRFDLAVEGAGRALALADALGDERLASAPVNLLGRIHCLRGEPVSGIAHARRSAEQMERFGNRLEQATITGVLAFALALAGRFEDAFAAADRALVLADGIDHLPTEAACHFFKGVAHGWRGDIAVSEPRFETAIALAESAGDSFRCYLAQGWRGEALLRAGRIDAAIAAFTASLALAERIGSSFHRGAFMALLAEAELRRGDLRRATTLAADALKLAEGAEEAWSLSVALRSRAEVLVASGAPAEALPALDRAAAIQVEQELQADLLWTRLARARALAAVDRPKAAAVEAAAAAALAGRLGMSEIAGVATGAVLAALAEEGTGAR